MKKGKILGCLIIAFLFCICVGCSSENVKLSVIDEETGLHLYYDGTGYEVTGYSGKNKKVIIPNKYRDKDIIGISDKAFDYNKEIESVVMRDNIKYIGEEAFNSCYALKSIVFSKGLETIKKNAFISCVNMDRAVVYNSLKNIEKDAFSGCIMNKIYYTGNEEEWSKISGNIIMGEIEDVYYYNENLPVDSNGYWKYENDKIKVSNSDDNDIEYFKNENEYVVKKYHGEEKEITIPQKYNNINIKGIGDDAFEYSNIEKVIIPDTVKLIGGSSFYKCEELNNVVFSKNLENIGHNAFSWCYGLKEIILPDSVKILDSSVFSFCKNLIKVEMSDNVEEVGNGTFLNCINLETVHLSNSLKNISEELFCGDVKLSTVNIPSNVETIQAKAFYDCYKVKKATLGNKLTSIGNKAFYDCGLSEIIIPESVTSLGREIFNFCVDAKYLVISDTVGDISKLNLFDDCYNLEKVYYKGTEEMWNKWIFRGENPNLVNKNYTYSETKPEKSGKYWHYVDNKIIEW